MDIEEDQITDEENDTVEQETVSGIGLLLKEGREKKGLSYEEMAQITKLRAHALEALENEAWHLLPPSVFVKGFIKSYAKALGLEESKLIELYQEDILDNTASSVQIISTPKRNKKGFVFVLIVVFGLSAVSLKLWMDKPFSEPAIVQSGRELPSKIPQRIEENAASTLPRDGRVYPAIEPGENGAIPETEAAPTLEGASTPDLEPSKEDRLELLQPEAEPDEFAAENNLLTVPVNVSSAVNESLVLTGKVHSKTYVKIYVDDQAPKEYMFNPGSRPQWKAEEGFYVMVGNASGIDFDLNGKVYRAFGKEGEVVRLSFPANYKRRILEE
jgi:cytoskeletal protein RodZ